MTTLEGKATAVSFTPSLTSGKQIGVLTIDGAAKSLYAPSMYDWSEINAKPTKLSQFTDDVVAGKYQPLATAINTSNIGEQMVGYAQRAGSAVDSETLGGLAPEMYAKNLNNPYIFKPLANALYKVWREVNSKEQKNISSD